MASFPKIRFVIKLQDWQIAIVAQFSLWRGLAELQKKDQPAGKKV